MVDVARGLATLPTRPPTPPRGPSGHRNYSSPSEYCSSFTGAVSPIQTPDSSPSSSAEAAQPARRAQKRVGFSPWTEYHKAPLICGNKADENNFKRLPPSRERKTSYTRSILKPFAQSIITNLSAGGCLPHSYKNFAAMLESVVQQLAGESRSSRLDVYLVLSGTLKAYGDLPDRKAIADKMGLLMQFIRRDMCATTPDTGVIDTVLVVQTLKLLIIFIWTPELSDYLSDDFQSFVVDRSIYVLEEHQMPKAIVTHHMHLLATQRFKSRVMTTDRANRLITNLDQIQDRVKGNGIIGQKMIIYQRLLEQVQPIMVSRVSDWIDHVFSGMLSTFKPIRARAIAFGIDAALALGTISTVSRAVMDIFNRSTEEGEKFVNFFCDRLTSMALSKEDGAHVPQIWSVPVLFLRARSHQLEHWEHMKAWLHIIQKCFNASDTMVKFQANVAWNRLVFAINPDTSTGLSMMKMLRQPLVSQLDRKASDKHGKQVRQVALASYCNLLYYALKPSATHQQLDGFWTQYVTQIVTHGFLSSIANLNMGCQIITALLGDGQPRAWNENRANELGPVEPDELPRVDPKWVRSRASSIIILFERIFDAARWSATSDQASPAKQAWHSFMKAIGDAGSKEVKVSAQCMEAVAEIFNMLQRLAQKTSSSTDAVAIADNKSSVSSIITLLDIAIEHIGPLAFSEKLLLRNSKDIYHVPATPSHKSTPSDGSQETPVMHILDLLLRLELDLGTTDVHRGLVKNLLQKAIRSRTCRGTQLEMLRDWMQVFRRESPVVLNSAASSYVWTAIAELAGRSLTTLPRMDHSSDSPRPVGHEYRDVLKILEVGLRFDNVDVRSKWEELCQDLIRVVRHEAGDGGVIIAVLEPLASLPDLKDRNPSQDLAFNYASLCMENLIWPSNGTAMERSRKAVWGVASTCRKSATFDPLDKTYDLVSHFLTTSYQETDTVKSQSNRRFLDAVLLLLQRVPLSLLAIFLKRVQSDLAVWVKDEGRKLHLKRHFFPKTRPNIVELWSAFTGAIETLPNRDSSMLRILEPLILSGFQSKHRAVVNETIRMWNDTFGCVELLEYPDCLGHYLQRLRSFVDLRLPGLRETSEEDTLETPFDFIDSQEKQEEDSPQTTPTTHAVSEVRGSLEISAFAHDPLSSPIRQDRTPRTSRKRTPSRMTSSARLRHEDSQIQFAAIECLPIGDTFLDSQPLTERQREVKERQQAETAAMFPDLRSSPRPKSRETNSSVPRISFVSVPALTSNLVADGATTPTLPPPQHGPMDAFIGSSPTPRSRIRAQLVGSDNIEPASSPPKFGSIAAACQLTEPPSSPPSGSAQDAAHVCVDDRSSDLPGMEKLDYGTAAMEVHDHGISTESDQAGQLSTSAARLEDFQAITPSAGRKTISKLDVHHPSDTENFVDASSSLSLLTVVQAAAIAAHHKGDLPASTAQHMGEQSRSLDNAAEDTLADPQPSERGPMNASTESLPSLEENISRVSNSFGDDEEGQSPSSEGPVSSQLKKDLGKAVGQTDRIDHVDRKPDTTATEILDVTKKRKRNTADGTLPLKKAKISSRQSNIQVVIEVPRRATPDVDDSDMLDCIVVDSRPATARPPLPLSGVRFEQTPSPSKSTRGFGANSVQKKRLGRPRKRAAEGDTPASDEMTHPTSKKRRASESPTQHKDRTSAGVTSPPVHKKRRSSRLSQISTPSSSQRSDNISNLQEDLDAGAVSVPKSKTSASIYANVATGGPNAPKETENDLPFDRGEGDHTEGSQVASSEPSTVPEKHSYVINHDGTENDRSTVASGEIMSDLRGEAYTGAGKSPSTSGLASDLHLETGEEDTPTIGKHGISEANNTTKSPRDISGVQDGPAQTRLTPGRSQPGSPNGGGILGGLKRILKDIQRAVLGAQEEREIDDVLFDIRKEVHEAGRRGVS